MALEIHISFPCMLEELNGHCIHQDSLLSTFQCPSQAHVPDLAVSYRYMMLKLSGVHIYPALCHTGINPGVSLQTCVTFYNSTVVHSTLKTFFVSLSPCSQSDFSLFCGFVCLKKTKNAPCSTSKKLKRHNSSLYPKSFKSFIRRRVVHL